MKMVIAGGRHFEGNFVNMGAIHQAVKMYKITEIVSGGADGADRFGERYAERVHMPIIRFPADWNKHGPIAGPARNRKMAEYTDYVFLFPGGRGTGSMRREAIKAGKKIVYDNGWIE